jgi:hypothetical protein
LGDLTVAAAVEVLQLTKLIKKENKITLATEGNTISFFTLL